jgi:hypothetical protein
MGIIEPPRGQAAWLMAGAGAAGRPRASRLRAGRPDDRAARP